MSQSGSGFSNEERKALKRPDSFQESLSQFFKGFANRPRQVMTTAVIIFVLLIGLGMWSQYRQGKLEKARDALFSAQKAFDDEAIRIVRAEKDAEPSQKLQKNEKKGAGKDEPQKEEVDALSAHSELAFRKLNVDEAFPTAVQKFKEVADQYSGFRPGFEAQLTLGRLYFDHGNAEQAIQWFASASKNAPSAFDQALAHYSLGAAYENDSKCKEAIPTYEKALKFGVEGIKGDLLLGIARCYEMQNDPTQAKTTYQRIVSEMPDTPYAQNAKIFQARLD